MSKPAFLDGQPPALQLLTYVGIAMVSVVIFTSLAIGINYSLFGIGPDEVQRLSTPAEVNGLILLQYLSQLGLFMIPSLIIAKLASNSPSKYLGFSRPHTSIIWIYTPLLVVCAIPFINAMSDFNHLDIFKNFFEMLGIESWITQMEIRATLITEKFLEMNTKKDFVITFVMVSILPAIGEELMFRGVIQKLFQKSMNAHAAIWIAAILFSAIHTEFYGFIPRMVMGAALGYLYHWSGNLWLPILAHFTNNGLMVTLQYLIGKNLISSDIENIGTGADELLFLLGSIVLTAAFFYLIYLTASKKKRSSELSEIERSV